MVKNPPGNAEDRRDTWLISGLGRSPGKGNGNALQYSCLGESHGQRSLAGYSPLGCKESGKTEATEHAHKHLNCSKISFRFNRFVSLTSQVSLAFPLHIWLIFSYFLKLCIFFTYLNILQKLLIIVSSSIYEEGKKSIFVFVLFPIKIVVLEWATSGLLCKISLHKIHWGKCFNQQNGPYTSESHPPM